MRTFSKLFLASMVALGAVACNVVENPDVNNDNEVAYMQVNITTPISTRSQTDGPNSSDGDTENALANESKISDVLLIITDNDAANGYKVLATAFQNLSVSPFTLPISKNDIDKAVEIRSWVFCNSTGVVSRPIRGSYIKDIIVKSSPDIWKADHFLMSNTALSELKNLSEEDLTKYNSPESTFDLGTINVQRAACRYDFKIKETGVQKTKFLLVDNSDVTKNVYINMKEAALINQSKEFFGMKQVTADGTQGSGKYGVAEAETASNYVVDTDWKAKNTYTGKNTTDLADHFTAHLSAPDSWTWKVLPTDKPEDTEGNAHAAKADYRQLWYGSENTIPGENNQKHGISTGVVFKAKIEVGDGTEGQGGADTYGVNINNPKTSNEPIYVYKNILYGTWAKLEEYASSNADLQTAVDVIKTAVDKGIDRIEKASEVGMTVYKPEANKGYYAYYYYWNKHNDNLQPNKIGIMEYASVRNNIYKIGIKNVKKFGHPKPGDDDPDPVNPGDPDEGSDTYFSVSVTVDPWEVRINDAEF